MTTPPGRCAYPVNDIDHRFRRSAQRGVRTGSGIGKECHLAFTALRAVHGVAGFGDDLQPLRTRPPGAGAGEALPGAVDGAGQVFADGRHRRGGWAETHDIETPVRRGWNRFPSKLDARHHNRGGMGMTAYSTGRAGRVTRPRLGG
jgi:hypothetical protein